MPPAAVAHAPDQCDPPAVAEEPSLPPAEPHAGPTLFVPPSAEARWLVRHLGWLVSPADGRGHLLSRAVGVVLVAPFTQLTFLSFDLQAFLYRVFHLSLAARVGHFVFMPAVNLFVMTGLARLESPLHISLATAYALVLLVWYAALARAAGLWLLWCVMVPVVAALWAGAQGWNAAHLPDPWPCALLSALMIAVSHLGERHLPPRVSGTRRWILLRDYLATPPLPGRLGRLALQLVWGTLDEAWASPRLLPYGFLVLMFRLGYRPELSRALDQQVARAWASGDPALDYVGIGGGTFLGELEHRAG